MKSFYHQLRSSLAGSPAPWKKSMFAVTYSWQSTIIKHCCFLELVYYLESLSNMLTSFMASDSFCSSVIPSIGLGCSSSTRPVTGLMLYNTKNTFFFVVSDYDYVSMRTNNAIISNNQSKDLIALWCLHLHMLRCSLSSLPFTCIPLFLLSAKNCGSFFTAIIHIPHSPAQMMDSERAGVLLAAVLIYLRLMQNTFVWLYFMLFRHYRNVMKCICLCCRRVLLAVSGWG